MKANLPFWMLMDTYTTSSPLHIEMHHHSAIVLTFGYCFLHLPIYEAQGLVPQDAEKNELCWILPVQMQVLAL